MHERQNNIFPRSSSPRKRRKSPQKPLSTTPTVPISPDAIHVHSQPSQHVSIAGPGHSPTKSHSPIGNSARKQHLNKTKHVAIHSQSHNESSLVAGKLSPSGKATKTLQSADSLTRTSAVISPKKLAPAKKPPPAPKVPKAANKKRSPVPNSSGRQREQRQSVDEIFQQQKSSHANNIRPSLVSPRRERPKSTPKTVSFASRPTEIPVLIPGFSSETNLLTLRQQQFRCNSASSAHSEEVLFRGGFERPLDEHFQLKGARLALLQSSSRTENKGKANLDDTSSCDALTHEQQSLGVSDRNLNKQISALPNQRLGEEQKEVLDHVHTNHIFTEVSWEESQKGGKHELTTHIIPTKPLLLDYRDNKTMESSQTTGNTPIAEASMGVKVGAVIRRDRDTNSDHLNKMHLAPSGGAGEHENFATKLGYDIPEKEGLAETRPSPASNADSTQEQAAAVEHIDTLGIEVSGVCVGAPDLYQQDAISLDPESLSRIYQSYASDEMNFPPTMESTRCRVQAPAFHLSFPYDSYYPCFQDRPARSSMRYTNSGPRALWRPQRATIYFQPKFSQLPNQTRTYRGDNPSFPVTSPETQPYSADGVPQFVADPRLHTSVPEPLWADDIQDQWFPSEHRLGTSSDLNREMARVNKFHNCRNMPKFGEEETAGLDSRHKTVFHNHGWFPHTRTGVLRAKYCEVMSRIKRRWYSEWHQEITARNAVDMKTTTKAAKTQQSQPDSDSRQDKRGSSSPSDPLPTPTRDDFQYHLPVRRGSLDAVAAAAVLRNTEGLEDKMQCSLDGFQNVSPTCSQPNSARLPTGPLTTPWLSATPDLSEFCTGTPQQAEQWPQIETSPDQVTNDCDCRSCYKAAHWINSQGSSCYPPSTSFAQGRLSTSAAELGTEGKGQRQQTSPRRERMSRESRETDHSGSGQAGDSAAQMVAGSITAMDDAGCSAKQGKLGGTGEASTEKDVHGRPAWLQGSPGSELTAGGARAGSAVKDKENLAKRVNPGRRRERGQQPFKDVSLSWEIRRLDQALSQTLVAARMQGK